MNNTYFREDNCLACLMSYPDAYYCSSADSFERYRKPDFGFCCGDYSGSDFFLKPKLCHSIPELNYKCSSDLRGKQDNPTIY